MCIEKHRDVVIIGDMLPKERGDVRIVSDSPMPQASLLDDLLPLADLDLESPESVKYHLVDFPVWVACGNYFDICKNLEDTFVSIGIGDDPIEGLTSLQPEDNVLQSARNIFSNSSDLSQVSITQPKAFAPDSGPGVIGFRILDGPNRSPAPMIRCEKDVADNNVRIKKIRHLFYISRGRTVAVSRAYAMRRRTIGSISGSGVWVWPCSRRSSASS